MRGAASATSSTRQPARRSSSGPEEVSQAELIVKVKEPLPPEYGLLRREQILMTYLHLAAFPELTRFLADRGVIGIAYETIQRADGRLPCPDTHE